MDTTSYEGRRSRTSSTAIYSNDLSVFGHASVRPYRGRDKCGGRPNRYGTAFEFIRKMRPRAASLAGQ